MLSQFNGSFDMYSTSNAKVDICNKQNPDNVGYRRKTFSVTAEFDSESNFETRKNLLLVLAEMGIDVRSIKSIEYEVGGFRDLILNPIILMECSKN